MSVIRDETGLVYRRLSLEVREDLHLKSMVKASKDKSTFKAIVNEALERYFDREETA